jgi:hypothetical protein
MIHFGYEQADWLERPNSPTQQKPDVRVFFVEKPIMENSSMKEGRQISFVFSSTCRNVGPMEPFFRPSCHYQFALARQPNKCRRRQTAAESELEEAS